MLLSQPPDAAKSAHRGLSVILVMFCAFALAGLASVSWQFGWFWWFILAEAVVAGGIYALMRLKIARTVWPPMD